MKVLFIGNSHTYFNDMPGLFADMCKALSGDRPEVAMLAYSNRTLNWHCKEYFSVRFALLYGQYDYCVIQQFGHPVPPREETEPYWDRLVTLCRSVGTEPVLYMTWARKTEPEQTAVIKGIYRALAKKHHAPLAPLADLFDDLRKTHPEIDLYWHDGSHASPYGTYLIAATLAALLLKPRDLDGLPDETNDFQPRFYEHELPAACEDVTAVRISVDSIKAKAIRTAVERTVLEQNGGKN